MEKNKKRAGCLLPLLVSSAVICVFVIGLSALLLGFGGKPEVKQESEKTRKIPFQEIRVTDQETEGKYYYGQLAEDEKLAYKEMLDGIRENKEQIYVHYGSAGRANLIFQYVLKDFPDIFWCDGSVKSETFDGEDPYTVLYPEYVYGGEEKETKKMQIEAAANECLAGISMDASDYEKILYVYEYIVNTVDYDMEAPDNQNMYSVFINKKSVCAGYSKASQYLLERLGVFCTYVTGVTNGNQGHAWNLVQCEGDYYYVDTTWGDPVFQATEGGQETGGDYINYDYMCCNDEELFQTHTPDPDMPMPKCEKMDFNYYMVNGMYYTQYDSGQVLKAMNDVISKRGNPVVFKFANSELYNQAYQDIFNRQIDAAAQNLAQWYGLNQVQYQYMDEAELNKITIYWQYE